VKKFIHSQLQKSLVSRFHKFYYNFGTYANTFWLGIPVLKTPTDLWIYQEIIHELKPDIIIECGTYQGGTALFLASICDLVQHGKILTIDIEARSDRPHHPRIYYLLGSSTSQEVVTQVGRLVRGAARVMVILDSDHHKEHVLDELRIYSQFVTDGSYLIVEDTNVNGHPIRPDFGPGPMEAVEAFLKETQDLVIDKSREKFHLTFNPNGYLKRIKGHPIPDRTESS